jgi:hypothetical protein
MLRLTWLPPVFMQYDHVSEAVVPAGVHQLSQHQTTTVDALTVGQHKAHLLKQEKRDTQHNWGVTRTHSNKWRVSTTLC